MKAVQPSKRTSMMRKRPSSSMDQQTLLPVTRRVKHEPPPRADTADAATFPQLPAQLSADFRRGNIKLMRMKNFITFDDATLHPGPRLNLIIGPNGTGKSSVVNAVLIALNGNLRILGRSNRLEQYIRHERRSASVEISIHDPVARNETRTLKRTFDHEQSSWLIDGKTAQRKDVDAFREQYNIQLENLCQFLPQDRVTHFSELAPQELLLSTMTAVGGQKEVDRMHGLHNEYVQLEEDERRGRSDVDTLEELKRKNASLQGDIDLLRQRNALLEKVRNMELYRPWVEYGLSRDEAVEAKELYTKAKDTAEQSKSVLDNAERPLESLTNHLQTQKQAIAQQHDSIRGVLAQTAKLSDALEKHEDEYYTARDRAKFAKERAQRRKANLATERRELQNLQEQFSEEALESAKERLRELLSRRQLLTSQLQRRADQKYDLQRRITTAETKRHRLRDREQELDNVKRVLLRKLNVLKRADGDVPQTCYEWIRQNQHLFRGKVYGPVAMELKTDSEYHARVIESCIPGWVMCAMVVETLHDRDVLLQELKTKRNIPVDILLAPTRPDIAFEHVRPIESQRHLGLYMYADDAFQAPLSVKRAILAQFPLHTIAIGRESAGNNVDAIYDAGFSRFYTPESSFNIRVSRYGARNKSTLINPLRKAHLFVKDTDDKEERLSLSRQKEMNKKELDDASQALTELNAESSRITADATQTGVEIESLKRKRGELQKQQEAIGVKQASVRRLVVEADPAHVDEEERKATRVAEEHRRRMQQATGQQKALYLKLPDELERSDNLALSIVQLETEYRAKTADLQALQADERQAREAASRLNEEYREAVRKMKRLKARAEATTPRSEETRELFADLPSSLQELDELIADEKARANAMIGVSESVIREHEERERKIVELEARIDNAKVTVGGRRTDLDARRQTFVAQLDVLVNRMSENFSTMFSEMGCVGELRLQRKDSLRDIHVEILVSYRDGAALRGLNPNSHSGGERMVGTMVYLMALQSVAPQSPFRIVDEMNQGMDQHNERLIMNMMIRDATQDESAQCFLISPKLLARLKLNRRVVPHIIINGEVDGEDNAWNAALKWGTSGTNAATGA